MSLSPCSARHGRVISDPDWFSPLAGCSGRLASVWSAVCAGKADFGKSTLHPPCQRTHSQTCPPHPQTAVAWQPPRFVHQHSQADARHASCGRRDASLASPPSARDAASASGFQRADHHPALCAPISALNHPWHSDAVGGKCVVLAAKRGQHPTLKSIPKSESGVSSTSIFLHPPTAQAPHT